MKPYIIDLKLKDTEKVNWKKSLSNYLKKSYGSRNWESFYDEKLTSNLDHLRNNANGELAPDALLEQNYKYYALLEHLNLRVGKNSSQLKIDFIWYDAEYSLTPKDQKYKQHTITFEKSCILYNLSLIHI